jgi:hypothetical protein
VQKTKKKKKRQQQGGPEESQLTLTTAAGFGVSSVGDPMVWTTLVPVPAADVLSACARVRSESSCSLCLRNFRGTKIMVVYLILTIGLKLPGFFAM